MVSYVKITIVPKESLEDVEETLDILMPYVMFMLGDCAVNVEEVDVADEN